MKNTFYIDTCTPPKLHMPQETVQFHSVSNDIIWSQTLKKPEVAYTGNLVHTIKALWQNTICLLPWKAYQTCIEFRSTLSEKERQAAQTNYRTFISIMSEMLQKYAPAMLPN